MAERRNSNLGKFIVGGAIGAAIAVFFAPRAGAELREKVWRRSEAWRTRAREVAGSIPGRVGPAVSALREGAGPAAGTVRERMTLMVGQVTSRIRTGHNGHESHEEAELQETADAKTAAREE